MTQIRFPQTPLLENDRVLMRGISVEDVSHLLNISENEPETWYYSSQNAAGKENLEKYIRRALAARDEEKEMPFIVFDKKHGVYAGSTRFYDIQLSNASLQLGFTWYGKQFRGTGLNKHCKFLLLDYAFNGLNMERVEFRADSRNARSIAAMKGIGCTLEGTLRSTGPINATERRDSVVLSILKNEWEKDLREKLNSQL